MSVLVYTLHDLEDKCKELIDHRVLWFISPENIFDAYGIALNQLGQLKAFILNVKLT